MEGLGGARGVAVSADGDNFYIIGSTDDSLVGLIRNAALGTSSGSLGVLNDGAAGVDGLDGPEEVIVSPDDKHVYVVTSGDDAVTVFARGVSNGALTFVDTIKDGENGATALDGARSIVISADNNFAYVAGQGDDAVSVFARETVSGTLTLVETEANGVGGAAGLDGVHALALSPDQNQLYASSSESDAVVVFARDAGTGTLTYLEHETTGLNGPWQLMVSPNGRYVLVACNLNHRVVVFERDAGTGGLSFVEQVEDGAGGVEGLILASALLIDPQGKHLYATGRGDNALVRFTLADLFRVSLPVSLR